MRTSARGDAERVEDILEAITRIESWGPEGVSADIPALKAALLPQ